MDRQLTDRIRFDKKRGKDIFLNESNWKRYKKKAYQVMIQKGSHNVIYNVPGRSGVVYNHLEDSYETVSDTGYVITGLEGEMYPVFRDSLVNYDVDPDDIGAELKKVWTRPGIQFYEGVQIPTDITFEVDIPGMGILYGNHKISAHGGGDYILRNICSKEENADTGYRIINGNLFNKIYEEVNTLA